MAARLLAVTLLALAFLALPARASDQHSTLTLLDGSTIAVDGPRDKPLYLKFWATWCGTCRAQMPHMEAIYKQHGDAVDVVAVNTGFLDSPEKIATYRKQLDLAVPVAMEPEGWLAKKLGVPRVEGVGPYKVPYSVVINRNGEVTYLAYDNQGVDAAIDAALK